MRSRKSFWISLALVNLFIVAVLGFTMRTKILFPIPQLNYRYIESAHSHFAFGGWVGLSLMTLLIYYLLPAEIAARKKYQWVLAGIEISALGMVLTFPYLGYTGVSIFFSSLYIVVSFFFAGYFIRDVLQHVWEKTTRLLAISAVSSMILSFIGPLGLVYILVTKSTDSLLYRDSVYTFLHFQYNGFFTLSVFTLFFRFLGRQEQPLPERARPFAIFLILSVIPSVFLSLLYHNHLGFYILSGIGSFFMLIALINFFSFRIGNLSLRRFSRFLLTVSGISFMMKLAMQMGTLYPELTHAVYGDRPVIIGFLHLVFLAFVSFFILALLVEEGYFNLKGKLIKYPIIIFATGVFANEILLLLQGLQILFKSNNWIYNWLLWGAAMFLVAGAFLLALTRLRSARHVRE